MRLALAQLDPTIGDVAGNTALVLDAVARAREEAADVLVTGEMALLGYPPRDLLFRAGVVEACEEAVRHVAAQAPDLTVIVGHPRRCPEGERPFANSASVCAGGRVTAVYDKRLLPGYDVFDDDRYFEPGRGPCLVEVAGRRLGLLICEDLWQARDALNDRVYPVDPVRESLAAGADALVALNANPFVVGKARRHLDQVQALARSSGVPVIAVQQVGAHDDLIFVGRTLAVGSDGAIAALLPACRAAVETIELPAAGAGPARPLGPPDLSPEAEIFEALTLGIRDYCYKTGRRQVIVGLSGGIDSSVTACIAAAAVGPASVIGVMMPSRYSAPASLEDAEILAAHLGLPASHTVPIESIHVAFQTALAGPLGERAGDVTDENIQARVRGLLLMAFSNASESLVLATGNKSELATGYCTIYGDMAGALSVLGDVVKGRVYDLARWINAHPSACGAEKAPIPQRSLTRPPSAELRPNQTDQDTLPAYEVLDPIVERYIEREQSAGQIIEETGFDAGLVTQTVAMIDRAQYKRDQAAIVLKVTPRSFGRGRPMPIAMRWAPMAATATRRAGDEAPKGARIAATEG